MSKSGTKSTVFVVDDDPGVGGSLRWLIESVGLNVELHGSASAFMVSYEESKPGCLVADVRMPGMSGLALLERLRADGVMIPVILISGHADVKMAVEAMKSGAFDFIEKPFSDDLLLDRIQKAVQLDRETRRNRAQCRTTAAQISSLTRREREVLDLVAAGLLNKEIAAELGLSIKTVETHRGHIMEKMGARTVADLIRTVLPVYEGASRSKIQRARHKGSLDEQGRVK